MSGSNAHTDRYEIELDALLGNVPRSAQHL